MSTAITHPQPTLTAAAPSISHVARRRRWPWAHPGVASERGHRAEQAYISELAHAEHAARTRTARATAR